MGCRYCMLACPFFVPKYEWGKTSPLVRKCDMCADRVAQGLQTACADACPTRHQVRRPRCPESPKRSRPRDNRAITSNHITAQTKWAALPSCCSPASPSSSWVPHGPNHRAHAPADSPRSYTRSDVVTLALFYWVASGGSPIAALKCRGRGNADNPARFPEMRINGPCQRLN